MPSVFPDELKVLFDRIKIGGHHASLDFYCRGCNRPVRLLFWETEQGMGGFWYSLVIAVLELEEHMGS